MELRRVPERALRQCLEPLVDIFLGLILGNAVPLLDLAFELFASAIDDIEIIVGELTPFLFDVALELFPISLESIPVHGLSFLYADYR